MRVSVKKSFTIPLALIIIFAIILILALGTGIVYLWVNRPSPEQQKMAEMAEREEEAFRQYLAADYPSAKKTLLDLTHQLDGLNAESARPNRNPHALDAMLFYVRLAKLEEKNGGAAQAEFMKEAVTRCGKLGWADCSEKRLRRDIDRMDEMSARAGGR